MRAELRACGVSGLGYGAGLSDGRRRRSSIAVVIVMVVAVVAVVVVNI